MNEEEKKSQQPRTHGEDSVDVTGIGEVTHTDSSVIDVSDPLIKGNKGKGVAYRADVSHEEGIMLEVSASIDHLFSKESEADISEKQTLQTLPGKKNINSSDLSTVWEKIAPPSTGDRKVEGPKPDKTEIDLSSPESEESGNDEQKQMDSK